MLTGEVEFGLMDVELVEWKDEQGVGRFVCGAVLQGNEESPLLGEDLIMKHVHRKT